MVYVEFVRATSLGSNSTSIPSHQLEFRQDRTSRSTLSDNHYAQESSPV